MRLDEKMIDGLRDRISALMSPYRFKHTAEVEKMAVRIGELYLPEKLDLLRAAALLHDVTKEKSTEEHIAMLESHGVTVTELDRMSPKTLHARTAELEIIDNYPEFADSELLLAVRRHTTGDPNMTVTDAVIYLADYIDMSRTFEDCVRLREYFWGGEPERMSEEERERHLWKTLVLSFDMTLNSLTREESPISIETVTTRNELLRRLRK